MVIGNPPYGADVPKEQIANIVQRFGGISKALCDTYFVFYVKALDEIVKPYGLLGFITPNTWKLIDAAQQFRDKLLNTSYSVYKIAQHLNKVFADATVLIVIPCLFKRILSSLIQQKTITYVKIRKTLTERTTFGDMISIKRGDNEISYCWFDKVDSALKDFLSQFDKMLKGRATDWKVSITLMTTQFESILRDYNRIYGDGNTKLQGQSKQEIREILWNSCDSIGCWGTTLWK